MNNLNNIPNAGNWGDAASKLNDNFNKIKQAVTTVENASKNNKGYFTSLSALNTAFPSPKAGQTAYVYDEASSTYYTRNAVNGAWVGTGIEAPPVGVDLAEYTKTGGSTKTTKYIDDTKANHGYDSSPKTLKEVDDEIVQLAGENQVYRLQGAYNYITDAIKAVPVDKRKQNLIVSYYDSNYKPFIIQHYIGNAAAAELWEDENNWLEISSDNSTNVFNLDFKNTVSETRLQVPYRNRKKGTIIQFTDDKGILRVEQNISGSYNFSQDDSWVSLLPVIKSIAQPNGLRGYIGSESKYTYSSGTAERYIFDIVSTSEFDIVETKKDNINLDILLFDRDYNFVSEINNVKSFKVSDPSMFVKVVATMTTTSNFDENYIVNNISFKSEGIFTRKQVSFFDGFLYSTVVGVAGEIYVTDKPTNIVITPLLKSSETNFVKLQNDEYVVSAMFYDENGEFKTRGDSFTCAVMTSRFPYFRAVIKRRDNAVIANLEELKAAVEFSGTPLVALTEKADSIKPRFERGSYDNVGDYGEFYEESQNPEFYNNIRSSLFIRCNGTLNRRIGIPYFASGRKIKLLEFTDKLSLISVSEYESSNEIPINWATRWIKLSISNVDGAEMPLLQYTIWLTIDRKSELYRKNIKRTDNKDVNILASVIPATNGRDMLNNDYAANAHQYDEGEYFTRGMLRLPPNYTPDGEPVRMIYFAHSSAYPYNYSFGYSDYVQYLVDEGYAVMSAFAWTNKQQDAVQYMSSPTNAACASAIYKFCVENYNLRKDGIFLFGKSHGGFQVLSIPYITSIPVLAAASLAGACNTLLMTLGYLNPDREATARDFGIEGDLSPILGEHNTPEARAFFKQHWATLSAYVPMYCGAINLSPDDALVESVHDYDNLEYTAVSNVPTKCWISPTDSLSLVKGNLCRKRAVERGGGIFEMRYMPRIEDDPDTTKSHHTVDTGGPFVGSITTKLGGVHENIPVAYAEMLQWFRRFEI